MTAINSFISVVEENPLLVVGGTLGAVFLFTLLGRGGGSEVARVMPEHTLQSQKIAADTNVALAGIQAQREQSYVGLAEVSAARDVGLYQGAVQATLGKQATDAAIAGAAYQFAGTSVQAKTAIAINEIQAETVNNQTRAMLAANMAGITAGYVANRDNLSLQSKALDVQKALGFREQQTIQARDTVQGQAQILSIQAGRDVAFKSLDVENLASERNFQTELEYLKYTPQLLDSQYRLAHLQSSENQTIALSTLETQQYIAKKATKTGILGQIISGGFGLAGNIVGALK